MFSPKNKSRNLLAFRCRFLRDPYTRPFLRAESLKMLSWRHVACFGMHELAWSVSSPAVIDSSSRALRVTYLYSSYDLRSVEEFLSPTPQPNGTCCHWERFELSRKSHPWRIRIHYYVHVQQQWLKDARTDVDYLVLWLNYGHNYARGYFIYYILHGMWI